jgi:taurine dehydrogenase small subunit
MADDCVFERTTGPEACGTRHFVAGDRGASEWLFTGTSREGKKVEVNGCDLFVFRTGKIAVKSSFFKTRTSRRGGLRLQCRAGRIDQWSRAR